MQKNNGMEFGLIGNRQLLLTTSVFKENFKTPVSGDKDDDVLYIAKGDEYIKDKASQMMLAEGLK